MSHKYICVIYLCHNIKFLLFLTIKISKIVALQHLTQLFIPNQQLIKYFWWKTGVPWISSFASKHPYRLSGIHTSAGRCGCQNNIGNTRFRWEMIEVLTLTMQFENRKGKFLLRWKALLFRGALVLSFWVFIYLFFTSIMWSISIHS